MEVSSRWGERKSDLVTSGMGWVCGKEPLYSRGVGVCAWCDGARRRRLQHLRGAHHHVKLTWIFRKKGCQEHFVSRHFEFCLQSDYVTLFHQMMKRPNCCCLTSCLCDGLVGGGLHRHSRGCSIADGGGREISKTCLSSYGLTTRTAPIAKRILDDSLEEGGVGDKSVNR